MTKAAKSIWTEEVTESAVTTYIDGRAAGKTNADIISELAEELNTSVPSVRSKLATIKDAEGNKIYQADKRAVGGASTIRKLNIVNQIEDALDLERGSLDSLEKGSKLQLEALLKELSA